MSTVIFPGFHISVHVQDIAFRLLGWPIHWYGIIISLGFLLAVRYCCKIAPRYGILPDDFVDMLLYAVPLCILGARLYYVIFYLDLYRTEDGSLDIPAMIRIWDGGLAIYGAVLMAVVVALVFCGKRRIPFFAFADVGAFGLLIGQIVGRWGNFVNVEAFGCETTLPWRMGIYQNDAVNGGVQYLEVHPTFLYESLWNLVGFLLLSQIVARHRRFDGQIFWSYLAWYGLGRMWIEGLRTDSLYLFGTGIRVSQLLAAILCILGTAQLFLQLRRPHRRRDLWVNRQRAKARREAALAAAAAADVSREPPVIVQEQPEGFPPTVPERKESPVPAGIAEGLAEVSSPSDRAENRRPETEEGEDDHGPA